MKIALGKLYLINLSALFLILGQTSVLSADPFDYKRLREKHKKNVLVDVVYDAHLPILSVSVDELECLPYKEAKKKLYPLEQRILTAFERLNAKRSSVDIIWEFRRNGRIGESCFIGLAPRWIETQFKNLSFTYADNQRVSFKSTFISNLPNITGSTFTNPMPLLSKLESKIKAVSGNKVWQSLKKLHDKTKKDLYNTYVQDYHSGNQDFIPNDAYDAIADVEILSYVLSSNKKQRIVYTGGEHADRIVDFLIANADFELLDEAGCEDLCVEDICAETIAKKLDFLDKESLPVSKTYKNADA